MARLAQVSAAVAALAVYALLCPPVSGLGDASELTLVLATNGVAHPTGYPLYVLMGHPFCVLLHALGIGWSLAANLWSAVGGAVAVAFLIALASELAPAEGTVGPVARWLAVVVPVSLFALEPILLDEASGAEVNSWSLAWSCGAAFAFARWLGRSRSSRREDDGARLHREAAIWGLVCGIGLAHHLMSVLVSVPLSAALIIALVRREQLSAGVVLAALLGVALPITSYGTILWRAWHPAPVQWPTLEPSLASVFAHVTGEQFRHYLGYFAPAPDHRSLLTSTALPFLFAGLACLLVGLWRVATFEARVLWFGLLSAAILVAGFTFCYGVPDPAAYFLPAMALGAAAAPGMLLALAGRQRRRQVMTLAVAVAALLWLAVPWLREAIGRRTAIIAYQRMIRSMWSAVPPDTAIVVWQDDRFTMLQEYQLLRGEKPALFVTHPDMLMEGPTRAAVRARFGVDPLAGITIPAIRPGSPDEAMLYERLRRRLVWNLNERTRYPVIVFDPSVPIVQLLRKPWEPPADEPRRVAGPHGSEPPGGFVHPR
jgi:hypothetical protein